MIVLLKSDRFGMETLGYFSILSFYHIQLKSDRFGMETNGMLLSPIAIGIVLLKSDRFGMETSYLT